MERIICQVGAIVDTTLMCGDVVLVQLSDTNFILNFIHDEESSLSTVTVDVDDIAIDDTDTTITFLHNPIIYNVLKSNINDLRRSSNGIYTYDGVKLKVRIVDKTEYSLLLEAISECNQLRDSTLRLQSVYRDVYYAGVYSQMVNSCNELITDELAAQLKYADAKDGDYESFSIFNQIIPQNVKKSKYVSSGDNLCIHRDGLKGELKAIEEYNSKSSKGIAISCTFCEKCSIDPLAKDLKIFYHPYVMKTFSNIDIFMCINCLKNWKLYRDHAIHESRLVLPGEVNEELCAVCSDCPQKIILCSACQRSYCDSCLVRLLEQKELEELRDEKKDWICMCCVVKIPHKPDIEEEAWKYVKLTNGYYSVDKKEISHKYSIGNPKSYINSNLINKQVSDISVNNMKKKGSAFAANKPIVQASINYDFHNDELVQFVVCRMDEKKKMKKKTGQNSLSGYSLKGKSSNTSLKTKEVKYPKNKSKNMIVPADLLPPVDPNKNELYYFGQYLLLIEKFSNSSSRDQSDDTEDVCFLCKDGGDLVECDYKFCERSLRCRKVYHTYCLSFKEEIPDDKDWICPRHFCDMCGADPDRLSYICKYCPLSLCSKCPEVLVRKYGMKQYLLLSDNNDNSKTISFVCQGCLEMYRTIKGYGDLKNFTLRGKDMNFPGEIPTECKIQNRSSRKKRVTPTTNNYSSRFSRAVNTDLDNPYQRVFTVKTDRSVTPKERAEKQGSPPILKKTQLSKYNMGKRTNRTNAKKRKIDVSDYLHTTRDQSNEPYLVTEDDIDKYTNFDIENILGESDTLLFKSFDDATEPEESVSTVSIDDGKTSAASSSPTS